MLVVESPKPGERILPSLAEQQVDALISAADNLCDKCIMSLLAGSGMGAGELAGVKGEDINWDTQTTTVIGKGNRQRKPPFTERTGRLLLDYLALGHVEGSMW